MGGGRGALLVGLPVVAAALSLLVGPAEVAGVGETAAYLLHLAGMGPPLPVERAALLETVLWEVRLPRVLLALLVGLALSLSGAALQALFRNPLVAPEVLGLSAGAAAGAALALALPPLPVHLAAFAGGAAAVALTYGIAYARQGVSITALILGGVIVNGIFTALLTIIQFLADPFRLQTIVQWTMGNLHTATWEKVVSAAPPILAGSALLLLARWRLNVLALGEEEARAVGVHPERTKLLILIPATLVATSAVAVAGIIAMVGLTLPHVARLLVGADNRRLLPVTGSLGALFLILVDDCSRTLAAFELPVGIFTLLLGGPVFIVLLRRRLLRAGL
ncbi:MAG: iron ABC transporter permease [Syntrophobacterales bacterium]|nr:iron ABC transporter permease [Syntrophobacterales bacterium]